MKNLDKNIDLIERYLDEDLTQQELEEFNHKLNTDPEFNRLFFEMDRLVEGIRISARQTSMEEKLARLEAALPVKKVYQQPGESPGLFTRLVDSINRFLDALIASLFNMDREEMMAVPVNSQGQVIGRSTASRIKVTLITTLALIVIASVIIFSPVFNPVLTPSQLAANHFEPYDNVGAGVKRGENDQEQLQRALRAYDRGQYQAAIDIMEEIPVTHENSVQIWMYGGNAYLAAGETGKAKEMFRNIIEENTGFVIQAKWYLSLCYLKEGDINQARSLLTEIENTGRYKAEEANEILKNLETYVESDN